MKYCKEYAALLDLFVDGELAAEDMKRIGDHLAECPGCRAYVDDALAIRAGFPDVEDTAVPEGFAQGVMERIRKSPAGNRTNMEPGRRAFRRWMGTAAALAACCALVILVRTGPAGSDEDAASPEGGSAVYSARIAAGAAESAETGIAPQAAPACSAPEEEFKEVPMEGLQEEEVPPAARARGVEAYGEDQAAAAAPTAVAPESALHDTAALCLTAEEAGDLLDGFTAVWENAVEWRYELNAEEYQALLEALGREDEMPELAEGTFLVTVTGPKE